MLLEMSGCRMMQCIPHSTSAQQRFRVMGRFRACDLAICLVSTASDRLSATKRQNTSPGIGQGSVPPGAPPEIDENVACAGDILFEIGVHGQRYQPYQDHQPQGECGEVADIVSKDVSLGCAATFRTARMEVGCDSHLLSATCTPLGGLSEHRYAENWPMHTGSWCSVTGTQVRTRYSQMWAACRSADQATRGNPCPTATARPVGAKPKIARSCAHQAICGRRVSAR